MTTDRPFAARYSIRTQLLALMVVAVLPLAALLVYGIYADARNEIRQAQYQVRTLAELVASDVNHTLESSRDIMRKFSRRSLVRQVDIHRCDPALADLWDSYPGFANLGVIDTAGNVICSAVAQPRRITSIARTEWFARAIREDRFIAGKPMIGPITGKWVSVLVYPIHDDQEQLKGLIALPLDLAGYLPGVLSTLLASDSTVEIVTADGTVVWHNRDLQRWVGKKRETAPQPGRQAAGPRSEWEGVGEDAVNMFFAAAPVALVDWHVQVGVPSDAIYAQTFAGAIRNSLLGLLGLMGIVSLALLYGRRIAGPILALVATAREIRAGRTGSRAALVGARETVELASEFNRMLDHLGNANQRLEMIIQSSPLAIYTRDLEGIVTSWNPAAERMFGWSAAEIVGQPLLTVPAGKQGETDSLRRRVLDGESIVQAEVRRQRKDGAPIDISTTLAPLRDLSGRASGYLAIAADISERRKAEESMRLAALVYDNSSEAMMVTDADNVIIAINPAFTAQTGY
ncbi:MAG: PAS domain S-box protein, partial [Pseudomonadota bacterium]